MIGVAVAAWIDTEGGDERRVEVVMTEDFSYLVRVDTHVERRAANAMEIEALLSEIIPSTRISGAVRALLREQLGSNVGPWT